MNTFATTNAEIGEMLTRSSAAMKAANNSLEETIALESAAVQITRNAETTGTAFRTVSMRIRGYDENSEDGLEEVSEELENISGEIYDLTRVNGGEGISIFTDKTRTEYKSTYDILKEISAIWDDLTDKQQADLLEKLGGKRGAQVIAGVLDNFDEVERAMGNMEDAAGSADAEMRVIQDSLEYKINALKQTWTGALQDMIDRGDLKNIIDELVKLSEALVKVIPKLKSFSTVLAGVGTAIAGVGAKKVIGRITGSLIELSAAGEKVKKLNEIKSVFKTIGNATTFGADGLVAKESVNLYRNELRNLTIQEQAAAISASGLNAQQAKYVLTTQEGTLAQGAYTDALAEQILAEAGLATASITLSEAQVTELMTKVGITAATEEETLSALGLTSTKEGELIVTHAANQADIESLVTKKLITEAQKEQIFAILGVTVAEEGQIVATNVLTGAFVKLWNVLAANPYIAIAAGIAAVAAAIALANKRAKEAREEIASNSISEWEEANQKYKENGETFEELAEKYTKLSKGVDSLGRNVSLSTDEFDEYHDVTNQIAEMMPNLVKGWDSENNAILTVKDSVEALTEAREKDRKAQNGNLIKNAEDIFNNSKDKLNDAGFSSDSTLALYADEQARIDAIRNLIDSRNHSIDDFSLFRRITTDSFGTSYVDYEELRDILNDAGIDTSSISGTVEQQEEALLKIFNELSQADRAAIQGYLVEQESILTEALNGRRDLFVAFMEETLDSSSYEDMSDDVKLALNSLGNSLSNSVLQAYNSFEDLKRHVTEIVETIDNLAPEDQAKFTEYIGLVTSWNNNEIPYDEYVEKIKEFYTLINTLFPGDDNEEIRKTFTLVFDIPNENELEEQKDRFINRLGIRKISKTDQLNGMPSYVEEMGEEAIEVADEWYDSLTKSEREFVDNLSDEDLAEAVTFESTEEFDEWLEKLQAEANIQIDLTYSTRAVENLDTMQDAFGDLTTAYKASVKNRDSSDKVTGFTASASDIQGVNDAFGGVTFNEEDIENVNALSNALEKYNTTLIENKGDAIAAQDATDELATAYVDQSGILKDLTEENKETYISYLKLNGITNAQEVVESRLSKQAQRTSENLIKLSKAIAQNRKALDEGEEAGEEYIKAIEAITDEVAALLSLYNDDGIEILDAATLINEEFVKTHLDDIYKATEGDIEALNRLRLEIARIQASKLLIDLDIPSEAVEAKLDDIMDMISEVDAMNIEVGATVDDKEFLEGLDIMMAASEGTADAVIKAFESMGYTVEWVPHPYKVTTLKANQSNIKDSKAYSAMMEQAELTVDVPSLKITRNSRATGAAVNNFSGSSYSDSDSDSGSSSDSDSNDFSESFDWIEKAIDRVEEELDRLDEQVDNTYKNWTSRNEALLEEIEKTGDEIKMQADASKKYEELANEVAVPEEYKIKVQYGEMSVEDIDESVVTDALKDYYNEKLANNELDQEWQDKFKGAKLTDEDFAEMAGINEDEVTEAIRDYWKDQLSKGNGTAEMLEKYNTNTLTDSDYAEMLSNYIQEYEDDLDKAKEATDKETELTNNAISYHVQVFENLKEQLDETISTLEAESDLIDKRISRSESMGYFTNIGYYDDLIANTQEQLDAITYNEEEAIKAFNEAVANGVEKGSEQYNTLLQDIYDIEAQKEDKINELIETANDKRQQLWDRSDWIEEQADKVYEEFTFLQDLLSGEKLYEDDGHLTDYGKANMGLISAEYESNIQEAERFKQQYEDLQKQLEEAPGDTALIERLNEEKEGWQNATNAIIENKKAMQDVLRSIVDGYLSNLQKIIDKYKDTLSSAKDLYDYQKNISDQTTNIGDLEKQLQAYAGDDSEEARKTRQELQAKLEEAEQNLEETQWDRYISETGDMLDTLYSDLEEYLNDEIEDLDKVVDMFTTIVNDYPDVIAENIDAIASKYGYSTDLTTNLENAINNNSIFTSMESGISAISKILNDNIENFKFIANPEENGTTNEVEYESSKLVVNDDGTLSIARLNGNAPSGTSDYWSNVDTDTVTELTSLQKQYEEQLEKLIELNGSWESDENGEWYKYSDGSYAKNEWLDLDGKQFYFDEDGYLAKDQYVDGKLISPNGEAEDEGYEWKQGEDGRWYYGNSENYATGHVKIDGQWHTFDDEGWWLGAYAKGSKSISRTGIGITNEDGSELVWRTDSGALLTPLNQGDMVFTSDMSRRLWEIAKGNIPSGMNITMPSVSGSSAQNVTANNSISIELPNVKNYDEFKKAMKNDSEMEKFWQEITIGQMMGNNSLKKNKY